MSEDQIKCNNCGGLNDKNGKYCIDCGKALGAPLITPSQYEKISDISSPKEKNKIKFQYKVLIYFGVVVIVNSIVSVLVMQGFNLSSNSFTPIFFGVFLLSMIVVGIFWGAGAAGSSDSIEAVGMCGAIAAAIFVVALFIPLWIFAILGPMVGNIASAIGEAISNAIEGFFSKMFADIEIPGFEPFLFIGMFMVLSMLIIYKFHLNSKK
jgi:hypothetical protein